MVAGRSQRMKPSFFSRPVPIFGNVAVAILFAVFFLVPFAFRGARLAVKSLTNDVKDWLPPDYPETKKLRWFNEHFMGEQFIIVTWPGCSEEDPRFHKFVEKLRAEVADSGSGHGLPDPDSTVQDRDTNQSAPESDEERAHKFGDQKGLSYAGTYYEGWGSHGEKWLAGDDDQWYYITPDGKLYQWSANSNLVGWISRRIQSAIYGKYVAQGKEVAQFGAAPTDGKPNEFHENPQKLLARLFKSIETGPEVLDELAGDDGTLLRGSDEVAADIARDIASDRLTGILFGPDTPEGFTWALDDFKQLVPEAKQSEFPGGWEETYEQTIAKIVDQQYAGKRENLLAAVPSARSQHWRSVFDSLDVEPSARQTCVMLTMSEVGRQDLSRVCGREVLGKPKGRILELAVNQCGIEEDELRMGGPPVDNVSIDQEGSITLVRLLNYSLIVGFTLAYLCFNRSFKMSMMVFFVGGTSAAASLAIIFWTGSTPDSVTMSMPSLVYVLGLSGAVHIVNYYRDAVDEGGHEGAAVTAIEHGWFPCTLAAFTTALGLISLCVSTLTPINKFGFFSAMGVMATVVVLFTYLPSALEVWAPKDKRKDRGERENGGLGFNVGQRVSHMWEQIGDWVVTRNVLTATTCVCVLAVFAIGLPKIGASVQLLKMFDQKSVIIRDYKWMESNLGNLVPMELVVSVDSESLRAPLDELDDHADSAINPNLQYSFLERAEIAARVQEVVELEFGDDARGIVGRGMSPATFIPPLPGPDGGTIFGPRSAFNSKLESGREELLQTDYLSIENDDDRELWRVSLRLAALNNVDYGDFADQLKLAVEPVMAAYRFRNRIVRQILESKDEDRAPKHLASVVGSKVLILGADPDEFDRERGIPRTEETPINQTAIFAHSLDELLRNRGFRRGTNEKTPLVWRNPESFPPDSKKDQWSQALGAFDLVVVANDHGKYDLKFIQDHANQVVDARNHRFDLDNPKTAETRHTDLDEDTTVLVAYTGIVPIVYKSQWALMRSLKDSIGLAFVMIAFVMMLLLRDWQRPVGLDNTLNVRAGMVSMFPNVFPVILVFGAMGHLGYTVDIGSMMTASVAMGIAVDDTIHFLNWFRLGLREGLSRNEAIKLAYNRCATAMTQTTLIGGFGLAVFAASTFTPTQQFGILMLLLLAAALIGDLIFLPALLAGPLGKYFELKSAELQKTDQEVPVESDVSPEPSDTDSASDNGSAASRNKTPHSRKTPSVAKSETT